MQQWMTKTIFKDRKCFKEFMVFKMLKSIFSWFLTDLYLFFISFFLHSNFSCMARSNIKCDSKFSTADHINFWSPSCLCLWGQGSSKQFYRVWECQRELDNQTGWGTTFRATHRGQGQSYWVWVLENIMDGKVFFRSTLQEAIVIRYFDL